ncbi:MAG: aldehyde ferredoxin oxidoreductase family protein [Candidatus Geothermarchaeales archaeon]
MEESFGYAGKILHVDLTIGKSKAEPLDPSVARMYLGGNGFAAKTLFEEVPPRIDPFDPKNVVVVASGPAQGAPVLGSGRNITVTKSPLTGTFFDSTAGGYFGIELKSAGYDAIIIRGRSDRPVYLRVEDEEVRIVDASNLWGRSTAETYEAILEETGNEMVQVACIGPGGENLVRYACTIFMSPCHHAAGRGGDGAVLGSKNLKAIAVSGSKDIRVADVDGLMEFFRTTYREVEENKTLGETLPRYGTPILTDSINAIGALGTRNWQTEVFEGAGNLSGATVIPRYKALDLSCPLCSVGCIKLSEVKSGAYTCAPSKGPEYESIFALGPMCGVDDAEAVTRANALCNDLGIDTISMGNAVAFAMECYERGLLTKTDVDGLDVRFGNPEALVTAVEKTGHREGLGDILAEGVKRMADKIGHGSAYFASHVKGMAFPGHSPRGLKAMALSYAVSNRGASHHDGRPTAEYSADRFKAENKARYVFENNHMTAVGDSLVLCRFYERVYGLNLTEKYVTIVRLVTRWDIDLAELTRIGERIYNVERAFNVREGFTRRDDVLPPRVMFEPIPKGPSKGCVARPGELKSLLDEYYQLRGWDDQGVPTRDKLIELGLENIARELHRIH